MPRDAFHDRLPDRVRRAIAQQQQAGEALIGWVQLAVVLLFGTLCLLSPKTFTAEAQFAPVPWVLGVYLGFTLVRLALVHRGWSPDAMLYASVVIDMALLFALIFSFHLQYMQPPSFYLKAPTLLYVFIFIALRALRFEVRFVVFAGLVAAAGWGGMAAYAAHAAGGMEMITRDYVAHMTANKVLIGAEIDKIVSILTVTAILAVAIARARALLVRAVAEGAAAHDLSRFFSPEVASHITHAEQEVRAGEGQARDAAVLFTDIRGFSAFAKAVEPDALMDTLAEYQARMVPAIQRAGGTIDKFMGDGIMTTFGATAETGRFAADALRAVDEVMAESKSWSRACAEAGKPALRVGAACASGRIIFGAVGEETRLDAHDRLRHDRLAGTAFADQRDRAALRHAEGHAVHRLYDGFVQVEFDLQVGNGQQIGHAGRASWRRPSAPAFSSVAASSAIPAAPAASSAARATSRKPSSVESMRIVAPSPFSVICIQPPVRSRRVE
jgi:adenylate cyclase